MERKVEGEGQRQRDRGEGRYNIIFTNSKFEIMTT